MATKFLNCDDENNQEEECEEEDTINYEKDNIGAFFKNPLIVICILWSFSFIICTLESYSGYSITNQKQKEENVSPKHSFTGLFEAVGETIKDELTIDWGSLSTKSSE